MVHSAVSLLLNIDIAHTGVLIMCLLQTIQVQFGILAHISLYHLRSQESTVVCGMVAEQEFHFRSLFHDDEHTTVYHQVDITTQNVDDLNGAVNHHILRHIDVKSILCQHRVQVCHRIFIFTSQLIIVFRRCQILQRTQFHTLRQMSLGLHLGVESVVHYEIQRC